MLTVSGKCVIQLKTESGMAIKSEFPKGCNYKKMLEQILTDAVIDMGAEEVSKMAFSIEERITVGN